MDQEQQSVKNVKNEAFEWVKAIAFAAALVFLIRWFVFAPFIVEGPSMQPNYYTGERLIVNKLIYSFHPPKRGEVIVFHAPEEKDYIKRVIATPGETIKVEGDEVFINDKRLAEPYIEEQISEALRNGTAYNVMKDFKVSEEGIVAVEVPAGHVFVMGDNRSNSKDSRWEDIGFVPEEKVVGRADLIFWPLNHLQLIKHSYEEEQ